MFDNGSRRFVQFAVALHNEGAVVTVLVVSLAVCKVARF